MPNFVLVPLGQFVLIFTLDRQKFDVVPLTEFEPIFIASAVEKSELGGVPLLCVDLLQVPLAHLRRRVVDRGARLANENRIIQLEVARLVLQAVNTICVKRVLCDECAQQVFQFHVLILRCEFGQSGHFWRFLLHRASWHGCCFIWGLS